MRKKLTLALGALLVAGFVWAQGHIYVSNTMFKEYIYYSLAADVLSAPFPGQVFSIMVDGGQPYLQIYDDAEQAFDVVPLPDVATTWEAIQTFTLTPVFNAGATIGEDGDDDITIVGPVDRSSTFREDFDSVGFLAYENDGTAAVTTNAGVNVITLQSFDGDNLGIIGYRIEAENGPGLAATPNPLVTDGVFTDDGYVDDVDNEGIQFTFGAHDNATDGDFINGSTGAVFTNGTDSQKYCEAQIDLADISAVDDFWFGWVLNDATDNPPASADFNTAAVFTLLDNTGDLYANTMIDDGAETVDDTSTDWTDGDQFILRVSISDDAVVFSAALTDASTTVTTLTTATAVLDGTATDVMKCVLGYTNVANESLGVTLNYVEIGLE
jgi:hypothetical protein